jgi:hypothetical protein
MIRSRVAKIYPQGFLSRRASRIKNRVWRLGPALLSSRSNTTYDLWIELRGLSLSCV